MPEWRDVRCESPTCDRVDVGGRLLFRRCGQLVVRADRHGSFIALTPLGAICRCGAAWKSPDLGDLPAPIDQMLRVV